MFMPDIGTKELVDTLKACELILRRIPNQLVPYKEKFDTPSFDTTYQACDFIRELIRSVEGRASEEHRSVRPVKSERSIRRVA
jgi:hypothetical protein